jgi:excisionase family DNA binding protein
MARMDEGGETLTVTQAARRLGLHRDTLLRQITRGVLRANRLGSIWVVTGAEVERYRREHRGKHGFASPDHPLHGPRAMGRGDGQPQRGDR